MDINQFEPNSHKYNREKNGGSVAEREKLAPVAVGKAKKKTLGQRFVKTFFSEDVKDVKGYLLFDVLVPAIKDTIVNMITGGANMLFYSDSRSARGRDRRGGYTPYDDISRGRSRNERASSYTRSRERINTNFDDIILDSRADCERVLDRMNEMIEIYGQVTVADLYDLVDISSEFTDNKWGWIELKGAGYTRLRNGGYVLDLPRVVDLK